jgi:hypothetical protein
MQSFELYRYQLLPSSQYQQDLFNKPLTADQIRKGKNAFFDQVLDQFPPFRHRGLEIKHKVIVHQGDLFILKVGAHKSVDRDTEEFRKERIESWPNVTVLIHNAPDTQVIAISRNQRAFASTETVAKLIERALTPPLRLFGLTIQIKEQFEKNNFWSVINENKGRVIRVRFEMIAPNMANISHALKMDLKQLNRDSNCQKANLELEAISGAALEFSENNELINGCVEYASQGGGDIVIKLRGVRKEVRTSTSVKSVQIDELDLQGSINDLSDVMKQLLEP